MRWNKPGIKTGKLFDSIFSPITSSGMGDGGKGGARKGALSRDPLPVFSPQSFLCEAIMSRSGTGRDKRCYGNCMYSPLHGL